MNREAVLLAREILSAVPAEQVNMTDWECGTQACLLGHMALSGKFPGLVMKRGESRVGLSRIPTYLPTLEEGFSAGASALEITHIRACELFYGPDEDERAKFLQDHKSLALARLDALLAHDNMVTEIRSEIGATDVSSLAGAGE